MSNPGNTGQRYKMSKPISAQKTADGILVSLSCGHDYIITADESNIDWLALIQERIVKGKKGRCNECEVIR